MFETGVVQAIAPGQEAKYGYIFDFLTACPDENRLIEAILMSTHNILFSI